MSESKHFGPTTLIGERIKEARKKAGINQAGLAERVGVSQPTVANWESGIHDPRRVVIARIAEALGVSPEWLAGGARSAAEGDKHPAAAYLRRAIRHTPVISLENAGRLLEDLSLDPHTVAEDYIPVTTNAERVFAIFADDEAMNRAFPTNTLVVIDYFDRRPVEGTFCLANIDGDICLRRWREDPKRLEPYSTNSAYKPVLVASAATIIGCARVSIRLH